MRAQKHFYTPFIFQCFKATLIRCQRDFFSHLLILIRYSDNEDYNNLWTEETILKLAKLYQYTTKIERKFIIDVAELE